MGDRGAHGWTTVGHAMPDRRQGRAWQAELERKEREAMAAWDRDELWPAINKPLFNGTDAKRFDSRLDKLEDLGVGAFGRVDKVKYGAVCLARKRIARKPGGLTIEDLRQEGLTMSKLDHCHVVKLVATYAPRSHELCLLIWPAAVCSLSVLLDDIESLRLGEGDRDDVAERLRALCLLGPDDDDDDADADANTRPFDFLCALLGCVARAMAHCHANGVRHLDIKPLNILLNPYRVYLADFGISRDVSGQDQTTTDGTPGTEKWRAPELYADHGSSMQLSDMYSLGLVYLNVATVLYNARLADFEDALRYSPRLSTEDRIRIRQDKIKRHLEKLAAHALVTPRFIFTYEGQETVRPRPVVSLISHMTAPNPRNRLPAEKVDEKLSMLGGIHQIYHAECCRRPVSWVEDKWDRKLTAMASLKDKHEQQRRRIAELEGRDETYETRLENARRVHEHDVARLQALLREAEDKCQKLELEKAMRRKTHNHDARREVARPVMPEIKRPGGAAPVGSGRAKSGPTPSTMGPPTQPTRRAWSQTCRPAVTCVPSGDKAQKESAGPLRGPGTAQEATNTSGSKLPLPVTPSRSETPALTHDLSMTDSSMSSSVFSRRSVETAPTPANSSPQLQRMQRSGEPQPEQHWTELAPAGSLPLPSRRERRRPTPRSPVLSMTASVMSSSPKIFMSDLVAEVDGTDSTARPIVPSLQPTKSWADVAKLEQRHVASHG
ncbi:kinase [Hirsutella rhossiliensis]|uniref:Kinase n=1 Tax=Hirsutella rhossiliensis TaxID=111463 RepID=A0A9P8SDC4_9HYPO|nr:kinase [Hirsutella rhossiliensis]KAH0958578.1 kinase [Hirsutella rhossiliensis]